jgi:hypothetical protein
MRSSIRPRLPDPPRSPSLPILNDVSVPVWTFVIPANEALLGILPRKAQRGLGVRFVISWVIFRIGQHQLNCQTAGISLPVFNLR